MRQFHMHDDPKHAIDTIANMSINKYRDQYDRVKEETNARQLDRIVESHLEMIKDKVMQTLNNEI